MRPPLSVSGDLSDLAGREWAAHRGVSVAACWWGLFRHAPIVFVNDDGLVTPVVASSEAHMRNGELLSIDISESEIANLHEAVTKGDALGRAVGTIEQAARSHV